MGSRRRRNKKGTALFGVTVPQVEMAGVEPASEEFAPELLQACSVFGSCVSRSDRQEWKRTAVSAKAALAAVTGVATAAPQLGFAQHTPFGGERMWTSSREATNLTTDQLTAYALTQLSRNWKSRKVGASVRTSIYPFFTRSGAAACNSEPALPVEASSSPRQFEL